MAHLFQEEKPQDRFVKNVKNWSDELKKATDTRYHIHWLPNDQQNYKFVGQLDSWSKSWSMANAARLNFTPSSAFNAKVVQTNSLTGVLQNFFQTLSDCIFYLSIILTGNRLYNASRTREGIVPESGLVAAEYAGAFIGGGAGAKVGEMIGSVVGPAFTAYGALGGSIVAAYLALLLVKDQEQYIKNQFRSGMKL